MNKSKYTSSINIIRDEDRDVNYIPTANTEKIANTILKEFKQGNHSFNIVGSYGTGKSSFIWAFTKSLSSKNSINYFNFSKEDTTNVKSINIVGEYNSLIEYFETLYSIKKSKPGNQNIFDCLYQEYQSVEKKGVLLIAIDEFGKFLEYASKNNPEKEMYFIQQLAEFVNHPNRNIIFLTTVHQAIDSYSYGLPDTQRNEWVKVKGRLKEIVFNEPVEQLLFFASEYFDSIYKKDKKDEKYLKSILEINKKHNCFGISNSYYEEVITKIYPLDLFSAIILTLSLQKYGQNQRSLFSFLQASDHLGLEVLNTDELFDIPKVYDYILVNLYSVITSKLNPDYTSWSLIKDSIEKVEAKIDKNQKLAINLIKTIGLLNLFCSKGASINEDLLVDYFSKKHNNKELEKLLKRLSSLKIIRFNQFSKSYKLYGGSDLDIEQEIINVSNRVNTEIDIVSKLKNQFTFSVEVAKEFLYKTGTPRLYKFEISDKPITKEPKEEIDGYINLVFNEDLDEDDLISYSKESNEAILYGFYKNTSTIKKTLIDIAKTEKVLSEVDSDDKFAIKELKSIRKSQKSLLNHYVLDSIYSDKIEWFFEGKKSKFINKQDFNKFLSEISFKIYHSTPIINMELINKHKVSGSINTARKQYFNRLVNNWTEKDLGYAEDKFPADKTIYWSLIKNNGIHRIEDDSYTLTSPNSNKENFIKVWKECESFMVEAKKERKPITELIETLKTKPYKLKQGVIDFLIPTFLFVRRGDFALYNIDKGYIPYVNDTNLYMITRNPKEFTIKSFELDNLRLSLFNKYRDYLNQDKKDSMTNESFIESIRPFLILYKNLTVYSTNTKRLTPEALKLRNAISKAEDPEGIFFDEFPNALGYNVKELIENENLFDEYIINFQKTILEIKDSCDELFKRIEKYLTSEVLGKDVEFPNYKTQLQKRFNTLKEHQILPSQKAFMLRVNSELNDRDSWLNSICFSLISKPLDRINDKDEDILKEKLSFIVKELDNLCDIKNVNFDENEEEVYKVELTSKNNGLTNHLIRISKSQKEEVEKSVSEIKASLSNDKQMRIAVLTELLKKELNE